MYKYGYVPTFGPFILPSDINIYKNQTISRPLTPPSSNSNGIFTFRSSNTAVATITYLDGIYSINVINKGITTITAIQKSYGNILGSKVSVKLTVTTVYPTFGYFNLPSGLIYDRTQGVVSKEISPPSSNSNGIFTFISSNTAVATITFLNNQPIITPMGYGYTNIIATQARSGIYDTASISVLLETYSGVVSGFSETTNNEINSFDFDSNMTTLFTNKDDVTYPLSIPAGVTYKFRNVAYSLIGASSNGRFTFGSYQSETFYNHDSQNPLNILRYFSNDLISSLYYKFNDSGEKLLIKLQGYIYGFSEKTFVIKCIINNNGEIEFNYSISSNQTSEKLLINYSGIDNTSSNDDVFLSLNGVNFNASNLSYDVYNILNGKTIMFK